MTEEWPASYLESFECFTKDPRSEKYAKALFDHNVRNSAHNLSKKWQLLDVCCGTGKMGRVISSHLESRKMRVVTTFVDQSPEILKKIELDSNDRTVATDVTAMHMLRAGSFDIVSCRYGFNNLPREKWLSALSEVLRVIKPGGLFLLQDHFVPGPTFSALVNEAEQFLARLEGKDAAPFIFSTEAFNAILDEHPLVASRVKAGYEMTIDIWKRIECKKESLPNIEAAKADIMHFYEDICLRKYQVLMVEPSSYIPVYNITYAIIKRS